MTRTRTEQEYYEALKRLLDRNETVSLNAVAIEAGKKSGSLRAKRYPQLVEDINRYIDLQEANSIPSKEPKFAAKIQARDEKLSQLEHDYQMALQKVISLERQVFQLQEELSSYRAANNNITPFDVIKNQPRD